MSNWVSAFVVIGLFALISVMISISWEQTNRVSYEAAKNATTSMFEGKMLTTSDKLTLIMFNCERYAPTYSACKSRMADELILRK